MWVTPNCLTLSNVRQSLAHMMILSCMNLSLETSSISSGLFRVVLWNLGALKHRQTKRKAIESWKLTFAIPMKCNKLNNWFVLVLRYDFIDIIKEFLMKLLDNQCLYSKLSAIVKVKCSFIKALCAELCRDLFFIKILCWLFSEYHPDELLIIHK